MRGETTGQSRRSFRVQEFLARVGAFDSSKIPGKRLTSGTHLDEFHGLHFGSLYMRSTCRGVKTSVVVLWVGERGTFCSRFRGRVPRIRTGKSIR